MRRTEGVEVGAVFPQVEMDVDAGAVRAYLQGVEDLGFDHVVLFDHVLGADPSRSDTRMSKWPANHYTHEDPFHEPFTLLSFAAALTERIGLATGVLVLPQRQTALVAKQAAEVAILSGGRLRLGVGTGWNHLEYEALGVDFAGRGRRFDEQVALLRELWSSEVVELDGEFHRLERVGIAPRPVDGRIPLWFGGFAPIAVRRAARFGDGFMVPGGAQRPELETNLELLRERLSAEGRNFETFGLEGRIEARRHDPDGLAAEADVWRGHGVSHIAVDTMQRSIDLDWRAKGAPATVDEHLEVLRVALEAIRS